MASVSPSGLSAESPSHQGVLARHPLISYFVIAFAVPWVLMSPMALGQDGIKLLPFQVPTPLYLALFLLGDFGGPTLAALLVTRALEGGEGVRRFLRRYIQWRVGILWYLVAIFVRPGSGRTLRCRGIGRRPRGRDRRGSAPSPSPPSTGPRTVRLSPRIPGGIR